MRRAALAFLFACACSRSDPPAPTPTPTPAPNLTQRPNGTTFTPPAQLPDRRASGADPTEDVPSPLSPPGSPPAPAPALPCRAVVSGTVTPALSSGETLPPSTWLTLAPGAKLTAKDPRSMRETTFEGPARVLPCATPDEEAWLASGTFGGGGGGERPGAEQWIVTPLGVVRYGAALLSAHVDEKSLRVRVATGVAFVAAAADARVSAATHDAGKGAAPAGSGSLSEDGWTRLGAGGELAITAVKPSGSDDAARGARGAVDACNHAADEARATAHAIAVAKTPSGDLAAKNVRDRRAARVACAIARVRVDGLPPASSSPAKSALSAALHDADERWHTLGE